MVAMTQDLLPQPMPAYRQVTPVGVGELEALLTELTRFSSIRYAIACRSWRSNRQ